MRLEGSEEHRIRIKLLPFVPDSYWYSGFEGLPFTVSDSGDPDDYFVTQGEHEGKHILKADCEGIT